MRKSLLSVAIGAVSIPLLGGAAYAAAHSVSDRPSPQVVITPVAHGRGPGSSGRPVATTSTTADDHGVDPTTSTTDDHGVDGPGHDAGDDRGVDPTTSTTDDHGVDGPGHDAGDDRGVDPTTSTTDDHGVDGPGHDAGDDHGDHSGRDHDGGGTSATSGSGHPGRSEADG